MASYECPYCGHHSTVGSSNQSSDIHYIDIGSKYGAQGLYTTVISCPNPKCKETTILAKLYKAASSTSRGSVITGEPSNVWSLKPDYIAKTFPSYIPVPINTDYIEACKIKDLSPKASATLSRRCLQGILRDFWGVNPGKLSREISQIKDKVDPLTWDAIEAVRTIGNIGAHMEEDINLMVDVEPEEAHALITLIELLIQDWYITRHERQKRLTGIAQMGADKKATKKSLTESLDNTQKTELNTISEASLPQLE